METINAILFILTLVNLGLWVHFINRRNQLYKSQSKWQFRESERRELTSLDNKISLFSVLSISIMSAFLFFNILIFK